MTKTIAKLAVVGLLAGVIGGAPVRVLAQDKPAPEKKQPSRGEKRQGVTPFTGKLTAVDKTAKTIKVGERTFQITSETKITKTDKPATLEEAVVGDAVRGAFRKSDDGKMTAITVHLGAKPGEEGGPRKKKEVPSK